MTNDWWWNRAPADQRFVSAILGLLIEAALGLWVIADTDGFFDISPVWGWFYVITASVLILFFIFQAWRAWKERE
jgi:hypothetical protein